MSSTTETANSGSLADEKQVAIFFKDGPDDLNALCLTFPIMRLLTASIENFTLPLTSR